MPEINFIAVIVAALIPNIIGAIYYGPLFGKPWMDSLGYTKSDFEGRNEPLIYGSALLLSGVVAFFLKIIVELVHKDVNAAGELIFASHHTFGHGALHGALICLSFAVPVIICLGLFQKSTAKNIILNVVFWLICFALMGGILDVWN